VLVAFSSPVLLLLPTAIKIILAATGNKNEQQQDGKNKAELCKKRKKTIWEDLRRYY
jgi:hypothetical protein